MSGLNPKNIIVPFDFSEESQVAVDKALAISSHPSDVHVIHVLPDLNKSEPGLWQVIDNETRNQQTTKAIRDRMSHDNYKNVSIDIEFGDPGHRIAEYAKQKNADLIVIPSHGRTGLTHMLIGSVAERVVRLSHCPVLVLRK
jgi:nucleotide-binding universal stress UspA family protein